MVVAESRIWTDERSCCRMRGIQGSEVIFGEARRILNQNLDVYDRVLEKQKYMAGDVRCREPSICLYR